MGTLNELKASLLFRDWRRMNNYFISWKTFLIIYKLQLKLLLNHNLLELSS